MNQLKLVFLLASVLLFSFCNNETKNNDSTEATETTKVTDVNYALAESQEIFSTYVERIAAATNTNGLGVFMHNKESADPNDTTVMRINFDTQYSYAILDMTEDATLTMPENHGRYQSAWFITEKHYNPMACNLPDSYTFDQEMIGSRYVMIVIRTQVNMKSAKDRALASALQEGLKITQDNPGEYIQSHKWLSEDISNMRKKYQEIVERDSITSAEMFGKKGEVSLKNHNCGAAYGWGGLTEEQAVYLGYLPKETIPYKLTLEEVPIAEEAFWSITVYDEDGFPQGDSFNINSAFADANEEGLVVIHFGGDKDAANYLDIFPGWNFMLRLYLPQEDYFNGNWVAPELIPID